MRFLSQALKNGLAKLGYGVVGHKHFRMLQQTIMHVDIGIARHGHLKQLMEFEHDIDFLMTLPEEDIVSILRAIPKSKSQNRQDIFALAELLTRPRYT